MALQLTAPINILHIGANWGEETGTYIHMYRETLQSITYIECIPHIARGLRQRMEGLAGQTGMPIHVVEALVSDVSNVSCKFHIASNNGASSSMFEPNSKEWMWDYVKFPATLELKTTTCDDLVLNGQLPKVYDSLVLDVQGAELNVLKGMKSLLPHVKQIITEYSTREFYKGGVLFDELHSFLASQGFCLENPPFDVHGDVYFTRSI